MSAIIFSAIILIFNLLFFSIGGSDHDIAVWIAYVAIHLAYLCAIITPLFVKKDKHQMVKALPLLSISSINFIVQLIVGTIIILISPSDHVASLVTELILLIIFLAAFVSVLFFNADTATATARQKEEICFIRDLSGRVKLLMGRHVDEKLDKRLERLYDTLSTSPTRSYEEAKPLESELRLMIGELETAVIDKRTDDAERIIDDALLLIEKIRIIIRNNQ